MNKIEMVDLKTQFKSIEKEVLSGIKSVCENAQFIRGPQVQEFADNLVEYTGSKYVIPCANGTDAIQVALMALGLEPGDEVIVPSWTYVATVEVISLLRLKPVFVDIHSDTFNIDISKLDHAYNPKVKAIVPVHLYGQCADMEPLMKWANEKNVFVVEDTAQAIGAEYTFSDGSVKQGGTIGQFGTTSFFPSKNLGCYGDGGAIFTQDDDLYLRAKGICNHGELGAKYHHDIIGVNSRLDTIQAVVLNAKLKHLKQYEVNRNNVAQRYSEELGKFEHIITPVISEFSTHVFHQYTMNILDGSRDALKKHLQEHDIPSMIYYPIPCHKQNAYSHFTRGNEDLEVTNSLSSKVLSLPIHTEMTDEQQTYIINSIKAFYNE